MMVFCKLGGKTKVLLLALHQRIPLLQEAFDDEPSHVLRVEITPEVLIELHNLLCTFEAHLGLRRNFIGHDFA